MIANLDKSLPNWLKLRLVDDCQIGLGFAKLAKSVSCGPFGNLSKTLPCGGLPIWLKLCLVDECQFG
jgi:hypothetical protein